MSLRRILCLTSVYRLWRADQPSGGDEAREDRHKRQDGEERPGETAAGYYHIATDPAALRLVVQLQLEQLHWIALVASVGGHSTYKQQRPSEKQSKSAPITC